MAEVCTLLSDHLVIDLLCCSVTKNRPRLLVIGGQWDILRGGSSALCCHLLTALHTSMDITILDERMMEQLNEDDKLFIGALDAEFMEPDDSSDLPLDYVDALNKWETHYSSVEDRVEDFTHVLIVNPRGIVALADGMLIDSLDNAPKVAVLNYLSPLSLKEYQSTNGDEITELDFLGWTKKVSFVMSVGPHMHGLWQKELDKATEMVSFSHQHVDVIPQSPLRLMRFHKSSSSSVHHIHTLPCASHSFFLTLA